MVLYTLGIGVKNQAIKLETVLIVNSPIKTADVWNFFYDFFCFLNSCVHIHRNITDCTRRVILRVITLLFFDNNLPMNFIRPNVNKIVRISLPPLKKKTKINRNFPWEKEL